MDEQIKLKQKTILSIIYLGFSFVNFFRAVLKLTKRLKKFNYQKFGSVFNQLIIANGHLPLFNRILNWRSASCGI